MKTHTTFTDPLESRLLAYGVEVDELLSMNNTETWTNELWTMFSGYMLAQKELGYSPNISKIFFTFRDLLLFFENVEIIRNRI